MGLNTFKNVIVTFISSERIPSSFSGGAYTGSTVKGCILSYLEVDITCIACRTDGLRPLPSPAILQALTSAWSTVGYKYQNILQPPGDTKNKRKENEK